ncbi:DUF4810 domain-containing protein [Xylophilus rhododendri]|uniref:DUF4810 domain-containing protein n=1 Tax=Xylophilus rhododendri TaxID=2697032 RepID=A0A857J9T7_9BURK|nr:DUF4810 domain-containing protein [Xylophilus rhododendri]QHI99809.1 DUF4810 domain-containing protein [Xylophilus rhododendri]
MHRSSRTGLVLLLAGAAVLGGCAHRTEPIYQWESYQTQVYQYLQGQSSDPQKQIASLEADFQKIRAQNHKPPPGFHAHLGMLYASVGKDDQALQEFQTEKSLFPESTAFIDMLLAKANSRKNSQQDKEKTL